MIKRISVFGLSVFIIMLMVATTAATVGAAEIPRMTKEELRPLIDTADTVVLDVRIGRDWKSTEFKIKGAVRVDPAETDLWSKGYDKGKTYVIYCA